MVLIEGEEAVMSGFLEYIEGKKHTYVFSKDDTFTFTTLSLCSSPVENMRVFCATGRIDPKYIAAYVTDKLVPAFYAERGIAAGALRVSFWANANPQGVNFVTV